MMKKRKKQKINKESGKMYLKRLRTLRLSSGLKQTDIAEILGIQQTVYSRYERGFQTIPLHFLVKLADFYNTSTDYTLNRTNEKNPR
ncbi:MAG: helix-turn-helix domain-containing protein [Monoglobus pectinilyticus]